MKNSLKNENPSFSIETDFLYFGKKIIAGIDEAGRGALAGPLTVAAVIFPENLFSDIPTEVGKINDSKKLTHRNRCKCYESIKKFCRYYDFVHISPELVDEININRATEYAVMRLIERIPNISHVLLDGNFSFSLPVPYTSVIKGDNRSISIAAASIVAKVERDSYMSSLDSTYDVYGFKKNAGYGTLLHRNSIKKYGVSDIHRKSYEPCRSLTDYGKNCGK